jgi:hypothetical protein
MSLRIFRKSDPSWLPHLHRDGTYLLNEREHGSERNRQQHTHRVGTLDEVARMLRTGRYVLRMSPGGDTSSERNLISPDDIEIVTVN